MPDCAAADDGCQTFYYTNQQSARLMFYHDHAWGITRLNVYAGEAAGYLITDATEKKLVGRRRASRRAADTIPLDHPGPDLRPGRRPARRGRTRPGTPPAGAATGNLWYHHVYMPAQNPGDPSGMSAYGRWMYGPWFWPPATGRKYGPIANPYYDPTCKLDDPATWQYQIDPFCEPPLIPGTPNISVGMEQFNDTPLVNGTAYPTTTLAAEVVPLPHPERGQRPLLEPAVVRRRPDHGHRQRGRAEGRPRSRRPRPTRTSFPTPDTTLSPAGPDWIQIGTEGGFLPAPAVVPNQPITWITDPTRFDVGNVDKHSLLLAPAERGRRDRRLLEVRRQDAHPLQRRTRRLPGPRRRLRLLHRRPDLSPTGAPTHPARLRPEHPHHHAGQDRRRRSGPGVQPDGAASNAFKHHADGSGVFESGQHPIIVGQAAYNSRLRHDLRRQRRLHAARPRRNKCDGFARINQQGGRPFRFDTLQGPAAEGPDRAEGAPRRDELGRPSTSSAG